MRAREGERGWGRNPIFSEVFRDSSASSDVKNSMRHIPAAYWTVLYSWISVCWLGIVFAFTIHIRKFPESNHPSVPWPNISFSDRPYAYIIGRRQWYRLNQCRMTLIMKIELLLKAWGISHRQSLSLHSAHAAIEVSVFLKSSKVWS